MPCCFFFRRSKKDKVTGCETNAGVRRDRNDLLQDKPLEEQQTDKAQLKEQKLKEQQQKEHQLKELQLQEQQLKEQQLKEQQLREQQLKEQQTKETQQQQKKQQQRRQQKAPQKQPQRQRQQQQQQRQQRQQQQQQQQQKPKADSEEDDEETDEFVHEILAEHNRRRRQHGVPALRHSRRLTEAAQRWAETLADSERMRHDPACADGENIAMKYDSSRAAIPGHEFAAMWYNEIVHYNFNESERNGSSYLADSSRPATGHFTQLVWKSSTQAGFGRATSKSGRVFVVGRYSPPGNYIGRFAQNVPPPMDPQATAELQSPSQSLGLTPRLGPQCEQDLLVATNTTTSISDKEVQTITETYRRPDGSSYTQRKVLCNLSPEAKNKR